MTENGLYVVKKDLLEVISSLGGDCDIPYETKKLNPLYCQCSAGWFQRLFSEVSGKPVSVKIINTITNGANECTFEIDCL